ncbi:MAG: RNB domain-containing ribonuclease [Thermoleophilia bacterium]|nr:RNB domain-containing ribonuclease [Thermoleophilia bacterium]
MSRGGPTTELVAEMVGSGRGGAARPAFEHGLEIPMAAKSRGEARTGDLVLVSVRGRSARVVKVFGPSRSPAVAMAGLLASEGMGHGFPRAVEREVAALEEGDPRQDPGRHDLTGQDVVTIDPLGAKDHDDAIAASLEGDAVRLWVHIADVAHYVADGGEIDREAWRRGCSVYVPGTVEPMLPARLSTDLCSLRPGADRRAVTVEMLVAPDGEVTDTRFYRSVIRSERRLTYPEVDAHLAGAPLGEAGMERTIAAAREAARRIRIQRTKRGALEIGAEEAVFELGEEAVQDVEREHQTESHKIVEDCMVAANEAVARYLIARGRPTLFRHHPDPDPLRIKRMYEQLATLGVATPPLPDRAMGPSELREAAREAGRAMGRHLAAERAKGHPGGDAMWALVLRSLMQAYYTPASVTHSGLASAAYLHFTSPIRRYPDLLVHRTLLDALGIGDPGPDREELEAAGVDSSEAERRAADIERRADRIMVALFLERQLLEHGFDRVFDGQVTGVIPGGAFIGFGTAFEGFMPVRELDEAELTLDATGVALERHSGKTVAKIGDVLPVRVISIDPLRGRTRLVRAESHTPAYMNRARARRKLSRGYRSP